jgi:hypothetical protein
MAFWRKLAFAGVVLTCLLLLTEHFLPHGRDLNPVNHWLSEYVLSDSFYGRWLMHIAFFTLAFSALSTSILVALQSTAGIARIGSGLLMVSAAGLAGMSFFNTDPNDGRVHDMQWPLSPGSAHLLLLYVAIGAAFVGIGTQVCQHRPRKLLIYERALLGLAVGAMAVQAYLVVVSHAAARMTTLGGITERITVLALLAWVTLFALPQTTRKEADGSPSSRIHGWMKREPNWILASSSSTTMRKTRRSSSKS